MAIRVGTSGWSYAHWRHGVVYPERLPPKRWLPHIATLFSTVEVNATYYRLPRPESVANWAAITPEGFTFTVKMWRAVTHYRRLKETREQVATFFDLVEPMPKARRQAVLVQLPPQMHADPETLDAFLGDLSNEPLAQGWPVVVEFRHRSWIDAGAHEVLDDHGAALCVHDMLGSAVDEPNEADLVYVRRHGPKRRYQGSYSDEALQGDARRMQGWESQGRDVAVYYNNDHFGNAVRDGLRLQALLNPDWAPGQPAPGRMDAPAEDRTLKAGGSRDNGPRAVRPEGRKRPAGLRPGPR